MINMKTFLFISVPFLCLTSLAQASEVVANVQLTHSLNIGWKKTSKYRHSADCYPLGKGDETSSLADEVSEHALVKKGLNDESYTRRLTSSHYPSAELGSIVAQLTKVSDTPEITEYRLKLTDHLSFSSHRNIGDSDCVQREYHWNLSQHRISGQIDLQYTMSPNQWVVALTLVNAEGQAANLARHFRGDLHSKAIESDQKIYLWGRPGSTIHVSMPVDVRSTGGMQASVTLKVHKAPPLEDGADMLARLRDSTFEEPIGDDFANRFMAFGTRVLADPKVAHSISQRMRLADLHAHSQWLFALANREFPNIRQERDLKAMAAAVSYKLALATLDELKRFCNTVTVKRELYNDRIQVPGFIAAHFWLNRDLKRISEIAFPEIRSFLQQLVHWENNGYTYAEVSADKSLFIDLRQAYIAVRMNSQLAQDIFGDLSVGIRKTVETFGDVSGGLNVDELLKRVTDLRDMQNSLSHRFHETVLSFHLNNEDPVKASDLLADLNDLETEATALQESLLKNIKLVNTDQESGGDFIDVVLGLLAHQVNIFDKPLSQKFAEKLRQEMVRVKRVKSLKQSYNQCLGGLAL